MKNKTKDKPKNKKPNWCPFGSKSNCPKIVIITIVLGLLLGLLLMGTQIANNKTLLFQYLNFLLTVCVLALLIDIKKDLKK